MIDIENIISYIISPELQDKLLGIRIVFLVVSLLLLGGTIFCLLKSQWLKLTYIQDAIEFLTYRPFGVKKITKTWIKILARLETAAESEYKLAVIEADEMLHSVLKRMGYAGKNFEEKLQKLTSATLSNIDQIYEAHKIRNNIVYDPDYQLSLDEAKNTLKIFEQAFQDLQMF